MDRKKRDRRDKNKSYRNYPLGDPRYYGVFTRRVGTDSHLMIDPIRYDSVIGLSDHMRTFMNAFMEAQSSKFFFPARQHHIDYNLNFVSTAIDGIRDEWNRDIKPMIGEILAKISARDYITSDDDLFSSGILDFDEAATNATIKSVLSRHQASIKRTGLRCSLYAQYFHQLSSRIEATTAKMLARNGHAKDRYHREILYSFMGSTREKIKKIDGFSEYDKLYDIWNFIKHNSVSAYRRVAERHPRLLVCDGFEQGDIACHCIDFSDALIDSILAGVEAFLRGYCLETFDEDEYVVTWNYEDYFQNSVAEQIEGAINPLGVPDWI